MSKSIRVILKASLILAILGYGILFLMDRGILSVFSLYNKVWQGRERFPYGTNARESYSFNVANLDAMFAAHEVSALPEKKTDEIRIFLIGDSSVWGERMDREETVSERLDGRRITQDGIPKTLRVYNLGFPWVSIQRDFLIFERAMAYEPDMIIWFMTMESLLKGQIDRIEMVGGDGAAFNALAEQWGISNRAQVKTLTFSEKRRKVFDRIRLQLVGYSWSATGIDQFWDDGYERMSHDQDLPDVKTDVSSEYSGDEFDWDILEAAVRMTDEIPVMFVNEPIFIASGKNHEIRYNMYYLRAAYDGWRRQWHEKCETEGYVCIDLWDSLSPDRFMDTPFHYDAIGATEVAEEILNKLDAFYAD